MDAARESCAVVVEAEAMLNEIPIARWFFWVFIAAAADSLLRAAPFLMRWNVGQVAAFACVLWIGARMGRRNLL